MTNFTHNNHLTYSIGNKNFGYRELSTEKYKVSVGAIDKDRYNKTTFTDELHRTAQLVKNEFGNDLILFLSGGTDSEIVARNFLAIGHRPKCVTLRFKNDYNISDVAEASAIANELDLDLELIDFDIQDFFYSGEASEFGRKIQCTQITYLMVYHAILKLNAPSVMGGETLLTKQINKDSSYWYYTFRENEDASAMRFSSQFNIPLVNEWFSYTPELLLCYLKNPDIVDLITKENNYKLSSVSSKNDILTKLYPNIRPKKKTHGFENLLAFNYEAYKGIALGQIKRLESNLDGIPYDALIEQLTGEIV